MPVFAHEEQLESAPTTARADTAILLAIAAAIAAFHVATNGQYGFHRDELQFLSDAKHLEWGFVSYPPFTPFIERISLSLFGLSLVGLRFFSVIAQALVIFFSGLMARDLGGRRFAQSATALAVALSPLPIFEATEFQYTSFAMLWWVLVAWSIIGLLKSENPRWWLTIGAFIGLGLLTKYDIAFYVAGILAGFLLTPARRFLKSKWFWAGTAIALIIFLPNLLWLAHHDFVSVHFLQHIHLRDVGEGRAEGFFKGQFLGNANLFAAPVWILGLIAFFASRRYRALAWMYLVPVAILWMINGRFYYVCAVYPMLLAMGSVTAERWLSYLPNVGRRSIAAVYLTGLAVCGAFAMAMLVPIATSGALRDFALKNSSDLREEVGWDDLVKTVASIRDSLPQDQQASVGILVGNYGEQGAIEMLGPAYHLPPPISVTNSAWLRGYPTPQPTTLIVIGVRADEVDSLFSSCRLAGHNGNSQDVRNEESQYHPDVFVCGPPLKPWPEFWKEHQSFG